MINNFLAIQTDESVAQYVSEVVLCRHGCCFGAGGAPCVISRRGRVVGDGGRSTAQVGVGAARVFCRLLSRCFLGPGCSLYLILRFLFIELSPLLLCPLLLIGLLPPLTDGAVSFSRAEVVDRDDTVKHRSVFTEVFGPVTRTPDNIAKVIAVLEQLDYDV